MGGGEEENGSTAVFLIENGELLAVISLADTVREEAKDLISRLKRAGVKKVIMLTGFADLKNAIESKKHGAEDFVSKPYDLVDLLTTIERVLNE